MSRQWFILVVFVAVVTGCSAKEGHTARQLPPLPCAAPPKGLYTPADRQRMPDTPQAPTPLAELAKTLKEDR